ncbi:PQQ-dependent sugar dehydrogenase [Roseibacillus ishigakijimensis]|uniref:PQQ-dependent sugar dehydrogenase n=1 Tax=Roseibacillus ishigakijimensis TaxID=454146 RepID=A0A934RQ05_9BACT|nr:PQQ-dependent sugar dehydrogenase [Roseibacillus ishigakijimensis]MBK1833727.1 PQQ-dependent sugar dehydrogenase [Roseibacillus ishigakijimensis]
MRTLLPLILFPLLAQADPKLTRVGGEFERPIFVTSKPDNANHLFIVEQAGTVYLHDQATGKTLEEPFLDISKEVTRKHNEEGLLGFALAPDYATSGRVYVNFSNHDRTNEIVRYTVTNPGEDLRCDPASKELLLTFKQPFGNHNGGYLEFGPDGCLYIGTGDGGSANDPEDNAQNLSNLLGKILRIDVSGEEGYTIPEDNPFANGGGSPEIYAYGLRNPWRCGWDGDHLYIADVGQNHWEEVNVVSHSELLGANFGWRPREGFIETPKEGVGGPKPEGAIDPVVVYKHGMGNGEGLSINGGYVYRGSVQELVGHYLYSDHLNPRIWSFRYENGEAVDEKDLTDTLSRPDGKKFQQLASFGTDADQELYVVEMGGGAVWKIVD